MSYKSEQKKFDEVKWYDSIVAGCDRCGTYEFCAKCKKAEKYPCARAKFRYENNLVRVAVIRRRG